MAKILNSLLDVPDEDELEKDGSDPEKDKQEDLNRVLNKIFYYDPNGARFPQPIHKLLTAEEMAIFKDAVKDPSTYSQVERTMDKKIDKMKTIGHERFEHFMQRVKEIRDMKKSYEAQNKSDSVKVDKEANPEQARKDLMAKYADDFARTEQIEDSYEDRNQKAENDMMTPKALKKYM